MTVTEQIAFDQACDIAEIRFINAGLQYPKESVEFSVLGVLKEKGIEKMFKYVKSARIIKKSSSLVS